MDRYPSWTLLRYPTIRKTFAPHPANPADRPRRRQRKIAVFVRCKVHFRNDLCAHVADFRRELAGFNVEILDFEILDFEIFG